MTRKRTTQCERRILTDLFGSVLLFTMFLPAVLAAQQPMQVDVLGSPPNYTRQDFPAGQGAKGIALGDFDGDGRLDVIATQLDDQRASVLMNEGSGSLRQDGSVDTESEPYAVAVGDFDQNQQLDFAVVNFEPATISVFLRAGTAGDGTLTFSSQSIEVGYGPTDVKAVDTNDDGRLDLVVPLAFADKVAVLLGEAGGSFAEPTHFYAGEGPQSVDAGDFNGDGAVDLIVAHLYDNESFVFLGDGAGGFSPVVPIAPPDSVGRRFEHDVLVADVTVGDFNGDGFLDAASIHTTLPEVRVQTGDGTGQLSAPTIYAIPDAPRAIADADLNRDGSPDLVILSQLLDQVTLLIAKGGKVHFKSPYSFTVGDNAQELAIGNFDDKSGRDILVSSLDGVTVLSPVEQIVALPGLNVKAPAPAITEISPTQGSTAGGYTMLIRGTNLSGVTDVRIGGTSVLPSMVIQPTNLIKVVVPPGVAGPTTVQVLSSMGNNTTPVGAFTYTATPSPEQSLSFSRLIYCNAATGTQLAGLNGCIVNSSKDSDIADVVFNGRPDIFSGKTETTPAISTDEVWFNTGANGTPASGTFVDDLGVTRSVTRQTGRFTVFPNVVSNDFCGPTPPPNTTCTQKVQYDIQLADLDGDFDLDVVGLAQDEIRIQIRHPSIFTDETATRVTGMPTPQASCPFFGGGQCHLWDDVDIGDIDQDGDLDIVGASRWDHLNQIPRGPVILLNDGSGNFTANFTLLANAATAAGQSATHASHDVDMADLDNDGDLDLIFTGTINNVQIRIFENTMTMLVPSSLGFNLVFPSTNPPFRLAPSVPTVGVDVVLANRPFGPDDPFDLFFPRLVKPLDFNNDGLLDLWFGTRSVADAVYINQGGASIGFFELLQNMPFPNGFNYGASVGDFDLDGRMDLMQGDYPGEPMIYLNRITPGQSIAQINASGVAPFVGFPEPLTDVTTGALTSRREGPARGMYWPAVTDMTTGGLAEPDQNADTGFGGGRTGFLGIIFQDMEAEVSDLDVDGDLDVFMSLGDHQNRANRIFLNDTDPAPLPASDVWMRDNTADTGAVPSSGMLWKSPDVWLRRQADCLPSPGGMPCTDANHQNPIFGQQSYIYGKIRNNLPGAQTIARAEVQFFIGKASTGLIWPSSFVHVGSLTVLNLQPNAVLDIGPLQWTPPNPAPANHFCFYVRIQTIQDPITIVEGNSVPTNVANSNNIVWRNINVLIGSTEAQTDDDVSFIVRNVNDFDDVVDLEFELSNPFINQGTVTFDIAQNLFDLWDGTSEGLINDGTSFQIVASSAALRGLNLPPFEEGGVTVFFQIPSQFSQDLEFNVMQEQGGETVGGSTFIAPKASYPNNCNVLENFERTTLDGWINSEASTCTGEGFVIGRPTEVSRDGVTLQVGGDHTTGGGNAIFVDMTSEGEADVGKGNCILLSPVYDVAEQSELSLFYYYGQLTGGNDPTGDFFRLEVSTDGGSTFREITSKGDETSRAEWTEATSPLAAGSKVQIRLQVSDGAASGELVAAGIDDFKICKVNL